MIEFQHLYPKFLIIFFQNDRASKSITIRKKQSKTLPLMEIDALKFTVLFSSTFVYGDKISRQNSKNKLCFEISQKNNDDSKTVQEEN